MQQDHSNGLLAPGLKEVLGRIERAEASAGRRRGSVDLVAVSKQQAEPAVQEVLTAGQTVFGENRVQEAMMRWAHRRSGLKLHLIGPLQTNKAHDAVALFDVIETVDRVKLLTHLATAIQKLGKSPTLLIQVNTGAEPQKAGVDPGELDDFVHQCRSDFDLDPQGLMCIPPVSEPPGPHFQFLAQLAKRNGLTQLSMGMSSDFETAIRFGATSVRVGSAIFGHRLPLNLETYSSDGEAD
jgi:pyridoxal phosphate enzyme (YggS family)